MVLPSSLVSTYQQYKQDTDSVATWLASTAKSLGFPADRLTPAILPTKAKGGGGRLKGKARAQAKKQGGSSSTAAKQTPTATEGPKHIISISDFVSLAQYLATKAAPVPEVFRATLERVITARSGFGAKLKEYGSTLSEASDARHVHFVDVLQNVREILNPFMPVGSVEAATKTTSDLSNRFAGLSVYEPSQQYLDAPDVERPVNVQHDHASYEAEPQTDFEDAIFAMTLLINDMNRIKAHVVNVWSNYKIGVFDVTAAAIATNTAIELVRGMMEDVLPALARQGGFEPMLQKFYSLQCFMKGWNPSTLTVAGKDNFNYETWDIAVGTYMGAYRLLECFAAVLEPSLLPLYKEGMFGHYDPTTDRSQKSALQRFADDRALLMPFFTEMMTAIRAVKDWPVHDEFLYSMDEVSRTGQVPFYAVFAAQVFLDITYELGQDIERPFTTLMQHTHTMKADIHDHFEFHKNLKMANWPASNDAWIRDLENRIEWIGADPLRSVQARQYQRMGVVPPETKSHRIFRMSPVISGLVLYHLRYLHREVGVAFANATGSIQHCQHLYNATRRQGILTDIWPDMEVVYENFGAESFYVGGEAPQEPAGFFKMFCLQMGTSAAAMAKSRRKNTALASKAGPRGLKENAPVQSMFKSRYVEDVRQVELTPEYVAKIIDLSLFEEEDAPDAETIRLGKIDDPKKLKEKKKLQHNMNSRRLGKKVDEGGRVAPEKLIRSLAFALHTETVEFSFPYLRMHRWCWRVLRGVKAECDAILRQLYTAAYIENESQLPWVVGWILMAGSGIEGGMSNLEPLEKATVVLKELISFGTANLLISKVMGEKLGMPIQFEIESDEEEEGGALQ
ncbi:hypothetical protein GQ53DRAFT_889086 [Thozetella sp. PMI_491]|nr:hypothetical protein GQ53DRAFT_889086 [Thozetella sp. PMI_491]